MRLVEKVDGFAYRCVLYCIVLYRIVLYCIRCHETGERIRVLTGGIGSNETGTVKWNPEVENLPRSERAILPFH